MLHDDLSRDFKLARKCLRAAIRAAKEATWKDLVNSWGMGYKIVPRKIGVGPGEIEAVGQELDIINALFPTTTIPDWVAMLLWMDQDVPPVLFTVDELRQAATRLPLVNLLVRMRW